MNELLRELLLECLENAKCPMPIEAAPKGLNEFDDDWEDDSAWDDDDEDDDEQSSYEGRDGMVVYAKLVRCPGCGVVDRQRVRGGTKRPFEDNPTKIQYAECLECHSHFRIWWE